MTFFAGERRDAGRDLDLGAACYPPVVHRRRARARARGADRPAAVLPSAADGVGAAGVALLVWRAVRVARARPPAKTATKAAARRRRPSRHPARRPRRHRVSPAAPRTSAPASPAARSLALALALTAHGAVWSARNVEVLRPIDARPAGARLLARAHRRHAGRGRDERAARPGGRARLLGHLVRALRPDDPACSTPLHQAWAPRGVSFVGINSDGGGATLGRHQGVPDRASLLLPGRARRRRRGRRPLPRGGAAQHRRDRTRRPRSAPASSATRRRARSRRRCATRSMRRP